MDIAHIRAETPGCTEVLHFNNAGASLPPDAVYQAVVDHLELERRMGGYEAAAQARERLECFYMAFSYILNNSWVSYDGSGCQDAPSW
jgi:cysteine desulfurase/selenocysteine lyase